MKTYVLLISFLIGIGHVYSQNIVTGTVRNLEKEELIGVNISVPAIIGLGTSSDYEGNYSIEIPNGCTELRFQYIGYKEKIEKVCSTESKQILLNVTLKEASEVLGTVVVSAGKFEQRIEEVTVSMDVIKPKLIENKTATSIDKTINQAPAVHIVDGQANIRSGSGWSYGAGSRVMVMVDGMPLMNGDQGAAEWQLIPMENISQIEIIKGASSVLFGSSALNGSINIRTSYPTSKPVNKLSITHTAYGKPKRDAIHWYKGQYNSATNISYFHSHKKDNKDFVLGTNLFHDEGFVQKVTSKRARINMGYTVYSNKIEGLTYGVKTNIMRSKVGDAIMWEHDTLAYLALDDAPGFKDNAYLSVDPFVSFNNPEKGIKHTLNTRYFRVNIYPGYEDSTQYSNTAAKRFSSVYYTDYQVQKQIKDFLTVTSGYTFRYCEGQDREIYGKSKNINHSIYTQADLKYKRINFSFGGRFENFRNNTNVYKKSIIRTGINYKLSKATFLRGSYGEGIRFPTMLERFVTYNTGPVFIYPNETLQPETGWSGEIGIKQGLKIGEWKGFVDLAAFIMEYDDMMEFSFGSWGPPTDSLFGFGFKSINIGRSQIKGIELSIGGEGKIGQTEITILGSYTYTAPIIDDKNYNYYQDSTGAELSYLITSSDTSGLLKYRYEHLAKLDLNVERNRLNCGLSIRLNSAMKNIDAIFESSFLETVRPLGIKASRERLNETNTIVDFRVGYLLSENNSMSFNIDNIFNREFLQRPASLGAPRTFSVLYKIKF